MKKTRLFLITCAIASIFISCQKEQSIDTLNGGPGGNGGGNSGTEVGNWKFVSAHVETMVTIEIADGIDNIKTVTYSDYTTAQNTGTINFNGTKATSTGIAYSMNAIAKGYVYENGALTDSLEFPFAFTLPPTNSTANYKKVGTDSLYFAQGGFMDIGSTGTGTIPTAAAGYKLKFEGDKLLMSMTYHDVKTETDQGITQKQTTHAVTVTTLQK